ncbi:MAG: RIP metalloprotease RseP, partial [Planctomycetota bacterium]
PLGVYVKLAGESPEEATGAPDEFWSKTPGQRSLVFVAGVTMNIILALVGFIAAFGIGVPFAVAEVGSLQKSMPAWRAGVKVGDEIVQLNGVEKPDFQDVTRQVALKGLDEVALTIDRDGDRKTITVIPEYDEEAGIRRLGFRPPMQPVVSGLMRMDDEDARCPAEEAGIKVGDTIRSIDGRSVSAAHEIRRALMGKRDETVSLEVERDGETFNTEVKPAARPEYRVGVSAASTEISALQGGGMAEEEGLRRGDEIVTVNGDPVHGIVGLENAIKEDLGQIQLEVARDGDTIQKEISIPDRETLDQFIFSFDYETTNKLTWVLEDGPAAEAGMRRGDRIIEVEGESVAEWEEFLQAHNQHGDGAREIKWVRDGEEMSATVTPALDPMSDQGHLGIVFDRPERAIQRFGVVGAVRKGVYKTYASMVDIFLTIKGFMSQQVSTKNVGGVVLIAYSSYRAAEQGLGKLLYLMAIISGALAFLNILPIPVLDGGHLMFEGIQKIRGKPVSEKVRGISQTIGMVLLLMLVVYAIRNDILRLFDLF